MPQEHYQRTHGFSTIPVIHPALYFDDCSGTFTWQATGTGADWTAEYDPIAAHVQVNGLLLKTRQTTPTYPNYTSIYRRLWLPPRGVLRLQLVFSTLIDLPARYLHFAISWNDGVVAHDAGLHFASSTGAVSYITGYSSGDFTWTQIPGWVYSTIEHSWNKLDLSFNLQTNRYHKIELNEYALDGTDIHVHSHPLALAKHVHLYIRLLNSSADQVTAYIDQILLTQEAP